MVSALLTAAQVIDLLPVSRATFFRSTRHDPSFPTPLLIGARKVWRENEIKAWAGSI